MTEVDTRQMSLNLATQLELNKYIPKRCIACGFGYARPWIPGMFQHAPRCRVSHGGWAAEALMRLRHERV